MAVVDSPLFSKAVRGGLGGVVYNQTGSINTAKARTIPANPKSARQLSVRGFLATCAAAWAGLTANQRAAWGVWAAAHPRTRWPGVTYFLTGNTAYTSLNTLLLDLGLSAQADPPTGAAPASPVSFAAGDGSGQTIVTWTSPGGTGTQMDIWLQGPISAGETPNLKKARHNCYLTAETATKTITGLSAGIYAVWGRMINEADGQSSTEVLDTCTVS